MNHSRQLALGEEVFAGERFCFIALLLSTNTGPPFRNLAFFPGVCSPFPEKPLVEPSRQCCWPWCFCFKGSFKMQKARCVD